MHDGALSSSLSARIQRVSFGMRRAYDAALAAHGVTAALTRVLHGVWRHSGVEQRALQHQLGVSGAALTGLVDVLVDRGLLQRRVHSDDARVKQLFLTPEGHVLCQALQGTVEQLEARLCAGLSASEERVLGDWLQRLADNLALVPGDASG